MANEDISKTVFMYGFVTGYARNAMNIEDITRHKDRKVIEHRIKVLNFFDCYGANATTAKQLAISKNQIETGDYHKFDTNAEALDFLSSALK